MLSKRIAMKYFLTLFLIISSKVLFSQDFRPDILGDKLEQKTLVFPDDYEGKVTATLVRRKAEIPTNKAVLYIHGFNDYFFQKEMAQQFNQKDFDFYALDLRKYGRSYLLHQEFNNVRDLREYDEEILKSLEIIENEGHTKVLLSGHSTGGLIVTLFASHYPENPLIKGIFLNSPFYDFNLGFFEEKIGVPVVSFVGRNNPNLKIKGGFSGFYGESLHQKDKGEWSYDLKWKPHLAPKVNFGFIRAIHKAQKPIQKGVTIKVPVLVMHAAESSYPKKYSEKVETSDVILDVKEIEKYAKRIEGNVRIMGIENGIHDLVLSKKAVREEVYSKLFRWLQEVDF